MSFLSPTTICNVSAGEAQQQAEQGLLADFRRSAAKLKIANIENNRHCANSPGMVDTPLGNAKRRRRSDVDTHTEDEVELESGPLTRSKRRKLQNATKSFGERSPVTARSTKTNSVVKSVAFRSPSPSPSKSPGRRSIRARRPTRRPSSLRKSSTDPFNGAHSSQYPLITPRRKAMSALEREIEAVAPLHSSFAQCVDDEMDTLTPATSKKTGSSLEASLFGFSCRWPHQDVIDEQAKNMRMLDPDEAQKRTSSLMDTLTMSSTNTTSINSLVENSDCADTNTDAGSQGGNGSDEGECNDGGMAARLLRSRWQTLLDQANMICGGSESAAERGNLLRGEGEGEQLMSLLCALQDAADAGAGAARAGSGTSRAADNPNTSVKAESQTQLKHLHGRLVQLVEKHGVPQEMRRQCWLAWTGGQPRMEQQRTLYATLCEATAAVEQEQTEAAEVAAGMELETAATPVRKELEVRPTQSFYNPLPNSATIAALASAPAPATPTPPTTPSSRASAMRAPSTVPRPGQKGWGGPPADVLHQIEMDVVRTCPTHPLFAGGSTSDGTMALRRVLVACACYHPDIGYTQSLNFVAGMLLAVMGLEHEESVFWVLVSLVDRLRGYYACHLPDLRGDTEVLQRLMQSRLPDLHEATQAHGLPLELLTPQWLMCLFATWLPVPTLVRLWDRAFLAGTEAPGVMLWASMALLDRSRDRVLQVAKREDAMLPHLVLALKQTAQKLISFDELTTAAKIAPAHTAANAATGTAASLDTNDVSGIKHRNRPRACAAGRIGVMSDYCCIGVLRAGGDPGAAGMGSGGTRGGARRMAAGMRKRARAGVEAMQEQKMGSSAARAVMGVASWLTPRRKRKNAPPSRAQSMPIPAQNAREDDAIEMLAPTPKMRRVQSSE